MVSTQLLDAMRSCPASSQANNGAIFPAPKTALSPLGGAEPFHVYGFQNIVSSTSNAT